MEKQKRRRIDAGGTLQLHNRSMCYSSGLNTAIPRDCFSQSIVNTGGEAFWMLLYSLQLCYK